MTDSRPSEAERHWPVEVWITFPLHWDLVSDTRRYIANLLEKAVAFEAATTSIGLAVHELLENAVKYGAGDMAILGVKVLGTPNQLATTVSVSTRVSQESAREVGAVFAEMERVGDAALFYGDLLEKHAQHQPASGLGFGRIWAEAKMHLSYSITGEDLTVVARGTIDMEEEP